MMQQLPHFPENHSTAAMASADMTAPEWEQRARLRWLQQQQQQQQQYYYQSFFTATPTALDLCRPNSTFSVLPAGTAAFDTCCNAFCDEEGSSVAGDLLSSDLIHCPIFGSSFVSGSEGSVVEGGDEPGMSRFSCPPAVGGVEADQIKATVLPSVPSTASPFGVRGGAAAAAAAPYQSTVLDRGSWESWRKRKAAHEVIAEEPEDDDGCYIDAMIVPKLETDPPISSDVTATTTTTANGSDVGKPATGTNKAATGGTSREKCTKVPDPAAKTGYIHVRARRGQATDSHSLAERARREKISKRMKLLQELVPGCSTITGKAGVLDEIINYVQSLQRQVEFLSMKLAVANPIIDSDIDALLSKEVIMQMVPHDHGGVLPTSPGTPPLDASGFLNHVNTIMQTQQAVAAPTAVPYCSSTTSLNEVAVSSSCPGELPDSLLQNRPWW